MKLLSILLVISLWCQPLVGFASVKVKSHDCCSKTEITTQKEAKPACCSKKKQIDDAHSNKKGCCKSNNVVKDNKTDKNQESQDCCGDDCQCKGCIHNNTLTTNAIWNSSSTKVQIIVGYIVKNQFRYDDFTTKDQNRVIFHPPKSLV